MPLGSSAPNDLVNRVKGIPFFGAGLAKATYYSGPLGFGTGNIYWVDSGHPGRANDTSAGGTPDQPYSSIDYAVGQCTASNGDIIFVMPGHTETVSAAAGLDLDVAGISIIGLGNGRNRPTINLTTATTADIDVDADNITLAGFHIDCTGVDALAAPIDVNAANFSFIANEVLLADAGGQATLGILGDANADRLLVQDCYFYGSGDAGTAAAIRLVGEEGTVIRDNIFLGAYTAGIGAIENVTTANVNCMVINNHIDNRTATSTKAMVFVATASGMIANNRMQILSGTAPITGAAMSWVGGNYYAATIATAGTLI